MLEKIIILIDTDGNIEAFANFKRVCDAIGLNYNSYKGKCFPMAVYTDKGYLIQKHEIQR